MIVMQRRKGSRCTRHLVWLGMLIGDRIDADRMRADEMLRARHAHKPVDRLLYEPGYWREIP